MEKKPKIRQTRRMNESEADAHVKRSRQNIHTAAVLCILTQRLWRTRTAGTRETALDAARRIGARSWVVRQSRRSPADVYVKLPLERTCKFRFVKQSSVPFAIYFLAPTWRRLA